MKIRFNYATGDVRTTIYTVLIDETMFGVLVTRKQNTGTMWSVFDKGGALFEGGISEEYYSHYVKTEIQKILETTLKEEYGYE